MELRPPPSTLTKLAHRGPCALLLTETDGTIRWVNETFCEWTGRTEADVVGRTFQGFLTVGGRIFHQTHWQPLMHLQGAVKDVFFEFVHADGSAVPVILHARTCHSGDASWYDLAAVATRGRREYQRELASAWARIEALLALQRASQAEAEATAQRLRFVLEAGRMFLGATDTQTGERIYEPGAGVVLGKSAAEPLTSAELAAAIVAEEADASDPGAFALELAGGMVGRTLVLKGVDGRLRAVRETTTRRASAQGMQQMGVIQELPLDSAHHLAAAEQAATIGQDPDAADPQLGDALRVMRLFADRLASTDRGKQARLAATLRAALRRAEHAVARLREANNGNG